MTSRTRRGRGLRVAVGAGAIVLAGGCAAPYPAAVSAQPAPTTTLTRLGPDERACSGVQATLGHLAASTAHWSPKQHPFDPAVAALVRRTSLDLTRQAPTAGTTTVRRVVTANAASFSAVAAAMTRKDRRGVDRAIAATRASYRSLKAACGLR